MFPPFGIKRFAERKRDLLLESDINRQVIRLECQRLMISLHQTRAQVTQGAWSWAAPVAGFLLARQFKKAGGVFAKGSLAVMALSKVWEFWQARRARRRDTAPGTN